MFGFGVVRGFVVSCVKVRGGVCCLLPISLSPQLFFGEDVVDATVIGQVMETFTVMNIKGHRQSKL